VPQTPLYRKGSKNVVLQLLDASDGLLEYTFWNTEQVMLNWSQIDTVLLDMDGTLLDLHFDNHFWLEFVPARYAARRGITLDDARAECMARYERHLGTLSWYSVDHWTQELDLDIALLKEEVDHLIAVLPHVTDFLDLLGEAGKRRVLVTNAHQKSLALKMDRTQLHHRLDGLICSHDIGLAKESPGFWPRLCEREPFEPARTLFVDDSLSVLRAARGYGIRWLLAIRYPDRRQPVRDIDEFPAIKEFDELIPDLSAWVRSH
jgi:putative hydrolase of the HAD superfamily